MALGASRDEVWRLVLLQGLRPALIGTIAGLVGALALANVLRSLLFGVKSTDALTFASVPLLLLSIAVLACLVPACRAARLDPASALRTE
jgi:ABC-type lipoprotein release transport system permease subunit